MLPICVRPERVWPKLSSIQGIRANLVYTVSLSATKWVEKTPIYIFSKFERTNSEKKRKNYKNYTYFLSQELFFSYLSLPESRMVQCGCQK